MMTIIELHTSKGEKYFLGEEDIIIINEHSPIHKGDQLYYEIEYGSGVCVKEFSPDTVIYELEE